MKIFTLFLTLLSSCVAIDEEPHPKVVTLTQAELQKLLGIKALKLEIPESFGDYYMMRVEVYQDEKLQITLECGGRVPNNRHITVAIQDTSIGFVATQLTSEGAYTTTIPLEHFSGFGGAGAYSEDTNSLVSADGRIILFERTYYRAKLREDGHSFSTADPANKKIGKCVVFIENNERKKSEQGGTGQPATRPESEGSDKPQPEAEGRSR
jgi:hypothetical protein